MALPLSTSRIVRLAQPSDIKRMGSVTMAGCHPSQSLAWQQPYYSDFPLDGLRTTRKMYRDSMMKEMNQVLVVIEDEYNTAENEFCPGVVTAEEGEEMPSPGEKVVVGVAMFVLPRSSERIGQFQNTKAMEIELSQGPTGRDTDLFHCIKWWQKTDAIKQRYFTHSLFFAILVVHPAYERRGHGANLVKWGMQLAAMDNINIGLIASEFGNPLYKKMGFQYVDKCELEGDEVSPRGVQYEVLSLHPVAQKSSGTKVERRKEKKLTEDVVAADSIRRVAFEECCAGCGVALKRV